MKLDNDFLKIQTYASQLFESLPVIKEFKNDKDLITQLQYSCVCYGRKLVSLFDKYTILQKKQQEGSNQLLINLASLLNVTPNEQTIMGTIKQQIKANEQLQSKVEYLKQSQQDVVYQKMLQHEQKLTQELQEVADRLIKELKQSKDDKQILLDELQIKEDQLKQYQQQLQQSSLLRSPTKQQYNSAQKYSSATKYSSSSKQPRFQQQLINTLQALSQQTKTFLSQYVNQQESAYDYDQLVTDDAQMLSMNVSNIVRDLTHIIQHKEEIVENLIKGLEIQLEQVRLEQQQSEFQQTDNKQLQYQLQQLQAIVKKAKDTRVKELDRAFNSEIPVFIVPDDLMDSELQLTIERHNSKVQQRLNDLAVQLKKKSTQFEQISSQTTKIKIILEEGLNRLAIILNELQNMADSNEALKLLKFCKNEIDSIHVNLNGIDIEQQISIEIKQQRQNWLQQLDQLKKFYSDQTEKLIQENEQLNEQLAKLQQLTQGLHNDNEQLMRKLKLAQQEEMQSKEDKDNLIQELELTISQQEQNIKLYEQQEKKQRQTMEQIEKELENKKREYLNLQQSKQLEQQDIIEKLTDKNQVLEFENKTYKQQLDVIEKDFQKLKSQRQTQDQLAEQDKQTLKKQLDEKKKQLLQLQTENKKQHEEAVAQIEELQDELAHISSQLQLRETEIKQLHKKLSELEDFSRKQIDVIRTYEDKLTEAHQVKKQLENNNEGSDQMLSQLQHRYQQLQQQSNQLKHENDKLLNDLSLLQKQYTKQKETMEQDFKDKMNKQSEINKILKEEARNLKAQLELKINQLRQVEQDLQDKNNDLDKAQKICKQLNLQVNDFRQKIEYFEDFKQENLETSEQYAKQIQQMQNENFQYRRELEKQQQQNSQRQKTNNIQDQQLKEEINNLKQEVRKMEQLLNQERMNYEQEIRNYQNQIGEYTKLDLSMRQKSGQSGGSAFYENLIEAKDLEIARLTNIVKSLTDLRK
ncbi:unnamed protein product (macronuclear) [Paramecium tetraurelia]|uniref:Uncharacterized protein n=1 Tax=Paramecium tetraurelia TaxID=5888 RepID=A0C6Q0_PARTE|nr:uncharacterized protein GSPATT00035596001 [Paramecium tetraurelia]CAK66467.1 unnamed protein product [Paramecium tetraurelia]|eukprot:XP_001433864.1 hypothetical protein (macronuclear) [Paramecium tetraurelia strain d4-2]